MTRQPLLATAICVLAGILILVGGCTASPKENVQSQSYGQVEEKTSKTSQPVVTVPDVKETSAEIIQPNNNVTKVVSNLGPTIAEKPPTDLKQQAKEGEVSRTISGVTLALKAINYEVKGADYAVITGINFGIVNEGSENIDPKIAVYLWDDNDPIEQKTNERATISVERAFGLKSNEYAVKDATVRIPFDDINLTKHIKLAAIDDSIFNPKTLVSVEYTFNVTK